MFCYSPTGLTHAITQQQTRTKYYDSFIAYLNKTCFIDLIVRHYPNGELNHSTKTKTVSFFLLTYSLLGTRHFHHKLLNFEQLA